MQREVDEIKADIASAKSFVDGIGASKNYWYKVRQSRYSVWRSAVSATRDASWYNYAYYKGIEVAKYASYVSAAGTYSAQVVAYNSALVTYNAIKAAAGWCDTAGVEANPEVVRLNALLLVGQGPPLPRRKPSWMGSKKSMRRCCSSWISPTACELTGSRLRARLKRWTCGDQRQGRLQLCRQPILLRDASGHRQVGRTTRGSVGVSDSVRATNAVMAVRQQPGASVHGLSSRKDGHGSAFLPVTDNSPRDAVSGTHIRVRST